MPVSLLPLIPLLPLGGFLLCGLFGRRVGKASGLLTTFILLAVTVLSVWTAAEYFLVIGKYNGAYQPIIAFQYEWLRFSSTVSIDMGIVLDPISAMMIVVVCFVSLMVHIFSGGYMKGEERLPAYFAFLGLFTFSMLGLVLSSNLFQLYIFWELVGLSSYLLIGFYFDRPSAVAAAKKAFIVTRFADFGFLLGILILAFYTDTLDIKILIARLASTHTPWAIAITSASFMGVSVLTWALLLIFAGGAGKSAMFPLHVWLPDAMEGPTPVSALIHAATMVVAGVYLVARLFPVFISDPQSLSVVAGVGAISALIAACIACSQTDIKRVLAYSTMSQIGYMMFALGVSVPANGSTVAMAGEGYSASMFHLFTHAFFKSLLFLCAGSVIHAVHSNEMKDMGGLRKRLPVTHICFLIACLAIAGIPPFAGFFSKEAILKTAYGNGHTIIYGVGLLVSGITAFYMFRLYFSMFWSRNNPLPNEHPDHHGHGEGTIGMKFTLVALAAITVVAGFVPFTHFVTADGVPAETHVDFSFSVLPVTLAFSGIAFAGWLYARESNRPAKIAGALGGVYRFVYRKLYIDELYVFVTKKIIFQGIGRPAAWIDKHVVDGAMNGIAAMTSGVSTAIRKVQSGSVQTYALYFFAGITALAVMIVYLWPQ